MATINWRDKTCETSGFLPAVNSEAPPFTLTKTDLSDCSFEDFRGKNIILNIFPSIDTPTCATSVRTFNKAAAGLGNTVVLCVSADLPFAHKRFCETEGIENVLPVSSFRAPEFGSTYGVSVISGVGKGLLARAVVVIDAAGMVVYTEQVAEISQEPDYDAALKSITE